MFMFTRPMRRAAALALAGVVTLSGFAFASPASAKDRSEAEFSSRERNSSRKNVVDKLAKAGQFNTLIAAVTAAGLGETLATTDNITVFAPTDAAFAKVPAETLNAILADKKMLTDILTYHVAPRRLSEKRLANAGSVTTLNGADIAVTGEPEDLVLNGNVNVILGDIKASNGTIHAIDSVLIPPAPPAPAPAPKDIVDTAIAAGSFKTLVTAVQAAGLEGALRSAGPFTVFAPTDDAFAKIPANTLNAIIADKALLTSILTYHVVGSAVPASDFIDRGRGRTPTLNGAKIKYEVVDGNLILNGNVKVIATDIKASNGIIHVIDTVLLPPPAH
jgi:transforming growth factor-beta-induced protein